MEIVSGYTSVMTQTENLDQDAGQDPRLSKPTAAASRQSRFLEVIDAGETPFSPSSQSSVHMEDNMRRISAICSSVYSSQASIQISTPSRTRFRQTIVASPNDSQITVWPHGEFTTTVSTTVESAEAKKRNRRSVGEVVMNWVTKPFRGRKRSRAAEGELSPEDEMSCAEPPNLEDYIGVRGTRIVSFGPQPSSKKVGAPEAWWNREGSG
jgi:hypothetical protein